MNCINFENQVHELKVSVCNKFYYIVLLRVNVWFYTLYMVLHAVYVWFTFTGTLYLKMSVVNMVRTIKFRNVFENVSRRVYIDQVIENENENIPNESNG